MKSIELWATHPIFDENTRAEAAAMRGTKAGESAFAGDLAFGTAGMRGFLGVGTNRMNIYTVARATQGLSEHILSSGGGSAAIAYDSRHCSKELADVAARVFARNGITAHVYPRIMPTPILSYAVRKLECAAGLMITASHNSGEYNGYKVYGPDGCQVTEAAADDITARISKIKYEDLKWMDAEPARERGLYLDVPESVLERYMYETFKCRLDGGDIKIKTVYTPLHGTGLEPVRMVFEAMGAPVEYVEEQCVPDGDFTTCPKPNPENPDAWRLALGRARQAEADIAIATDPDCDRVGLAVREGDDYRLLSGNEIGLLLSDYLLEGRRRTGRRTEDEIIVKTIVSTDLSFAVAREYGARVVEVLTGFKYIGEVIAGLEREHREASFVLGFEESCGYLAGTHVRDKDAVMATMLIVDMANRIHLRGSTVSRELARIYSHYGCVFNATVDHGIEDDDFLGRIKFIMDRLRSAPPAEIGGVKVERIVDYIGGVDGLPPADVISFVGAGGMKVIVRPSGTEPKIKAYIFAAGADMSAARLKAEDMKLEAVKWFGVR